MIQSTLKMANARESGAVIQVFLSVNDDEAVVQEEIVSFVRQSLANLKHTIENDPSVNAKDVYDNLRRSLRNLSMEEYELVFTELVKDVDIHGMLQRVDKSLYEKKIERKMIQQYVDHVMGSPNFSAVVTRAAVTTTMQVSTAAIHSESVHFSIFPVWTRQSGLQCSRSSPSTKSGCTAMDKLA